MIPCCLCGLSIEPNGVNMCINCLASQVDITEHLHSEHPILQCRKCLRFQRGTAWMACGLESQELMAICLKSVHGLSKDIKLTDANFVWTEPHSKRLKLKLTVQKEVHANTKLKQSCVIEFIIQYLQCTECNKQYTNAQWKALVQLRQKVDHKKTFLNLEQMLLKSQAHEHAVGIDSVRDGMDFYFGEKNSAEKFVHYLASTVPCRSKSNSKLISSDNHNNTANVKTTFSCDIVPVCKMDLVLLPKKLAQQCQGIARLCVVEKITTQIKLVDPLSCQRSSVSGDKFWRDPKMDIVLSSRDMIDFIVLDIEPIETPYQNAPPKKKISVNSSKTELNEDEDLNPITTLAEVEVVRESDFGVNDTTFHLITHLGLYLKAGDTVKGYDLTTTNFSTAIEASYDFPDIILVKKQYIRQKKLKLKSIGARTKSAPRKVDEQRNARDYAEFLDDYMDDLSLAADPLTGPPAAPVDTNTT